MIPDDEPDDPYARVRSGRAGTRGDRPAGAETPQVASRARLLQEMFCEIQDRFGGLSDDDLWAMTPRNFYSKLQQAERLRRRWIADMANAAMYGGADQAQKHIAALYKQVE